MMTEAELKIIQEFTGSAPHAVFLKLQREALISDLALLIGLPVNDAQLQPIHQRIRMRIELLVESRLDTIDAQVLSLQAVSQFETGLPTRVDYVDNQRADASSY